MSAILADLYLSAEYLAGDAPGLSLSSILDFDHVVTIEPMDRTNASNAEHRAFHVGTPTSPPSAPECYNPSTGPGITIDGWELITDGLTGQHGYVGPWLHDSEVIAGGVARRVLEHAERTGGGYYVAVYATFDACEECHGAGVVWAKADTLDESEEAPCPEIAKGNCEPGATTIEGWAIAYRPTATDTESEVSA